MRKAMWTCVMYELVLVVLTCLTLTGGTPTISSFTKVATLNETAKSNIRLSTIKCSDPDGDPTNTKVSSLVPSSPCTNCFEVLDCSPDECLQYRAGVGTLSHSSASSYTVTVSCEDGIEPPAREVIQVIIIPNTPPYFNPDVLLVKTTVDAKSTHAGDIIYDVDAIDDDSDDIKYSLTVNPSSSAGNYQIDPITGVIKATVDLKTECRPDVTFMVTIDDGRNKVGPLVISTTLDNSNTAPIAVNLDRTIQIPEDKTQTNFRMVFVDVDSVTYNITSSSGAGQAQFLMDGTNPKINIIGSLDYEKSSLRFTDFTVTATDGFCTSPPYNIKLQVTDVNEKPQLQPMDSSIEQCEGQDEFDPGYTVTDPDYVDTVKWNLQSPSKNFAINPNTGALIPLIDYDVDNKAMPDTVTFLVTVTDKGNLTATATVTVTFVDCNDNAPVFSPATYTFASTECASAGTVLGSITARDNDSSSRQNNYMTYSGSSGSITVGSGGQVILNQPMPAGTVVTLDAYATDHGQVPGPLRSVNPAVISVRFTPCPTTPPPTTSTTTTTVKTPSTTASTTTAKKRSYTKEDGDENLPWIILAALLGTFMLGLLSFMLWRYGHFCAKLCRRFYCDETCKRRPPAPRTRPTEDFRRSPTQKTLPKSSPPSEPINEAEPPGPGFLFGFWKERYPDDDIKAAPDHTTVPTPGDMEPKYTHTIDPVDPPVQAET